MNSIPQYAPSVLFGLSIVSIPPSVAPALETCKVVLGVAVPRPTFPPAKICKR